MKVNSDVFYVRLVLSSYLRRTILAMSVLLVLPGLSHSQINREYDLKAAFIFNFCKYVEWPGNFSDSVYVAVLGDSPITEKLRETAKDHELKNRPVSVRHYSSVEQITHCDLLFISKSYSDDLKNVLFRFSNKPTLLIGERSGLAAKGLNMSFVIFENKLRFEVNLKAQNSSLFQISANLLKHAIIVDQ